MASLNNIQDNSFNSVYADEVYTDILSSNDTNQISVQSDLNIVSPSSFLINGFPLSATGDTLRYDSSNNRFHSFTIDNYNRDVSLYVQSTGPYGTLLSAELNSGVRQNLILYQNYSQNSPISGYKKWSQEILSNPETFVQQSVSGLNTYEIAVFAIAQEDLNQTFISTGIFDIIQFANATGSNRASIFCRLYHRSSGGVETLLGTSDEINITDIVPNIGEYQLSLAIAEQYPLNAGEYVVLKMYAKSLSSTFGTTVEFYYEGQAHYSNSITPFSIHALLSDYYTKTESDNKFLQNFQVSFPLQKTGIMTGPTGCNLSIPLATASTGGYLSASKFAEFDAKVSSQWTTLNDNIYYGTGTNRVGIGLIDPITNLHIHTPQTAQRLRIKISDGTSGKLINDGFDIFKDTDQSAYIWNNENQPLWFGTNNSQRMRISNTGNVSIGSSFNNNWRLEVVGDVNIITTATPSNFYRVNGTQLNTSHIPENTNLYYTDTRSRSAISANTNGLTYNNTNGVFSLALSSGSTTGALSNTDWTTFNNKENVLSFSSPLSRVSNTVSIPQATSLANGFLSSADWSVFNGKENVLSFTSPLTRATNTISIPKATTSVSGYLDSVDFNNFNNKVSSQWVNSGGGNIYFPSSGSGEVRIANQLGIGPFDAVYDLHLNGQNNPTIALDCQNAVTPGDSQILFIRDAVSSKFASLSYLDGGDLQISNSFPTGRLKILDSTDITGNITISGTGLCSGNFTCGATGVFGTITQTGATSNNLFQGNLTVNNNLVANNIDAITSLDTPSIESNSFTQTLDIGIDNTKTTQLTIGSTGATVDFKASVWNVDANYNSDDSITCKNIYTTDGLYAGKSPFPAGMPYPSTNEDVVYGYRSGLTGAYLRIQSDATYNSGLRMGGPTGTSDHTIFHNDSDMSLRMNYGPTGLAQFNSNQSAIIGTTKLGLWSVNNSWMYLQNSALADAIGNYSLIQENTGNTYVNAPTSRSVQIRNNNSTIASFTPNSTVLTGSLALSTGYMTLGASSITTTTANTLKTEYASNVGGVPFYSYFWLKGATIDNSTGVITYVSDGVNRNSAGIALAGNQIDFHTGFTASGVSATGPYSAFSRMTLTAGGNLGVGISAPASRLHVHNSGTSQDVRILLTDATSGSTNTDGFALIKSSSQQAFLVNYENQPMYFYTNSLERGRFEASGNFVLQNSIQFPNGGNSNLGHYEEVLHTTTFRSGTTGGTTASPAIKCIRVGKTVTLTIPAFTITITTTNQTTIDNSASTAIPANFRPTATVQTAITGRYNSTFTLTFSQVTSSGFIYIYRDIVSTQYAANTTLCGLSGDITISYNIN